MTIVHHVLISVNFLFRAYRWRDGRYAVMMLSHGLIYPVDILTDLGTDSWVIGLATKGSSLEHQALHGTFAHHLSP